MTDMSSTHPQHARPFLPGQKAFSLSLQRGKGTIIDELLVIAWLIAVPLDFPMASAFRYPVTLLVLMALIAHRREIMPLLKRGSFLFALPLLCVVSMLWSDVPLLSLKFGAFMAASLAIAAYSAARLDQRQFVVAVLIATTFMCIGSLLFMRTAFVGGLDGGYAVIGIFPQKNVLGGRMLILLIAALCVLMDHRYQKVWRLLALVMMLPALYLLFRSNSATAVILLAGGSFVVLSLGGIWRPAAFIRGLRPAIAAFAVMAVGAGGLYLANVEQVNPYTEILDRFGKDTSLTGRTQIWEMGNQVIAESPILGKGANAFWQPGINKATHISRLFYVEDNRFYFHNAYYEVMVHLGIIGLIVFMIVMMKMYYTLLTDWFMHQRVLDPFFIGFAAILLVRSFTESELFSVFLMQPMILWVGVFMALQRQPQQPAVTQRAV